MSVKFPFAMADTHGDTIKVEVIRTGEIYVTFYEDGTEAVMYLTLVQSKVLRKVLKAAEKSL